MVISVITAALILVGAYLQVLHNLNRMMTSWDRDVHISAYFYGDVPIDRRFSIKDEIGSLQQVAEINYLSEDDAAAFLTERLPDIAPILDEFGNEVLPASLEITLRPEFTQPEQIGSFVESLSADDFEEVDYGQEWVQKFEGFVSLLKALGGVVGALIAVASIFLVANTVHLVVYARKPELETMKLVGATFGFMITPFLIESLILGVIAGSLAIGGLYGIHHLLFMQLSKHITMTLGPTGLAFLPASTLFGLLLIGVLLAVAGCTKAVRTFWKAAA